MRVSAYRMLAEAARRLGDSSSQMQYLGEVYNLTQKYDFFRYTQIGKVLSYFFLEFAVV